MDSSTQINGTQSLTRNPGVNGEGIEDAFIKALQTNVTLLKLDGIESSMIDDLVLRNNELIPKAVRRAALMLIGIRRSTDIEGMGDFAILPKDIVRLIAQTVYATRRDPMWIKHSNKRHTIAYSQLDRLIDLPLS